MKHKLLISLFLVGQVLLFGCQQKAVITSQLPNNVDQAGTLLTQNKLTEINFDNGKKISRGITRPVTESQQNVSEFSPNQEIKKVVLALPKGSPLLAGKIIIMFLNQPGSTLVSPSDNSILINTKSSYYLSVLPENFSTLEYPDTSPVTSSQYGDNKPHYNNGILSYIDKSNNEIEINAQNIALALLLSEESASLIAPELKSVFAENALKNPIFLEYKTLIENKLVSDPKSLAGRFMKPFPPDELELGKKIYEDSISKTVN